MRTISTMQGLRQLVSQLERMVENGVHFDVQIRTYIFGGAVEAAVKNGEVIPTIKALRSMFPEWSLCEAKIAAYRLIEAHKNNPGCLSDSSTFYDILHGA